MLLLLAARPALLSPLSHHINPPRPTPCSALQGSTEVGRIVMREASERIVPVTLELVRRMGLDCSAGIFHLDLPMHVALP